MKYDIKRTCQNLDSPWSEMIALACGSSPTLAHILCIGIFLSLFCMSEGAELFQRTLDYNHQYHTWLRVIEWEVQAQKLLAIHFRSSAMKTSWQNEVHADSLFREQGFLIWEQCGCGAKCFAKRGHWVKHELRYNLLPVSRLWRAVLKRHKVGPDMRRDR